MNFQLELMQPGKETEQVLSQRAVMLASQIRIKQTEDKEWQNVLAGDIECLRSWNILQCVDGYHAKDRKKMQELAARSLTQEELQEALTIAVNSALHVRRCGAPGFFHGHDILYEAIAKQQDSFLHGVVPPELEKRLLNGRFWETLPELSPQLNGGSAYRVIEDTLSNHFRELGMEFVPMGLKIFHRNTAKYWPKFYLWAQTAACRERQSGDMQTSFPE